jgi:hypothetical protein
LGSTLSLSAASMLLPNSASPMSYAPVGSTCTVRISVCLGLSSNVSPGRNRIDFVGLEDEPPVLVLVLAGAGAVLAAELHATLPPLRSTTNPRVSKSRKTR